MEKLRAAKRKKETHTHTSARTKTRTNEKEKGNKILRTLYAQCPLLYFILFSVLFCVDNNDDDDRFDDDVSQ